MSHKGFIVKMRSFMAPEHKRFIEYLENRKYSLRHLVQSAETDILLSSYNNCLSALIQLRTYHIQIVSKYVVVVSKEMNEGNYKSLDTKGTGGTSLIPFLKDMRKDTEGKILSSQQLKKHSKFSQISWLTIGAFAVVGASVIISAVLVVFTSQSQALKKFFDLIFILACVNWMICCQ
ncbi:Indoleamine 2,3-dioxygenase 2 [Bulinus truncatus]|nr:Indoleamine 2,3-dioxygenase 2 [Bulinus truncatus]